MRDEKRAERLSNLLFSLIFGISWIFSNNHTLGEMKERKQEWREGGVVEAEGHSQGSLPSQTPAYLDFTNAISVGLHLLMQAI